VDVQQGLPVTDDPSQRPRLRLVRGDAPPAPTGGAGDLPEAERLAAEVADLQFENASLRLQLQMLTSTDLVTGLPNLNGMLEHVEAAVSRLDRGGEPFGLMALRIPALRSVEQLHGRAAHEEALRHAGALIAAALRKVDRVGRTDWGFLVVLPKLDGTTGAVVDRLEQTLQSVPLRFGSDHHVLLPAVAMVVSDASGCDVPSLFEQLHGLLERAAPGDPRITGGR
jgi:PleD family two-component response regulator